MRPEPRVPWVGVRNITHTSIHYCLINGRRNVCHGDRLQLVENSPMQLYKDGEQTDQADDDVGVFHGAMPLGIVMFSNGEIALYTDSNE